MKKKPVYFTMEEMETLLDFYNHWNDKLTEENEEFYSYWIKRTGTAFARIYEAKERNESKKS